MKRKDLTEKQIQKAKEIYNNRELPWDARMKLLMELFDKSERTVRRWTKKLGFVERPEIETSEQYELAKQRKINRAQQRFIITWAQNDTPVHKGFFKNIVAYAEHIDADIHVIAGRYKNPTSVFTDKEYDTWDNLVVPYLDANRHNLHKYLSIMSDLKIQPTAVNPMSGLQGISGVNTCVFGSPKVQLEMIPVLEGNRPKAMLTTGAVTKMNYTDSKAGKKGEFHHTFGFVIVEIKDRETFCIRQVTADDKTGGFTDLIYRVENEKIEHITSIEAIVLGDVHYGSHDEDVLDLTHDFLNKIKPKHVVLHDVFDGKSINHHESKDPFIQFGKECRNENSLEIEIEEMLNGLERFEKYENVVIVRSNHDDFLDRWLKNEDWKKQPTPKNYLVYMEYAAMLLRQYRDNTDGVKGVIPEVINRKFPDFITLGRNDSYRVKNWELGQHGDIGTNGTRGSLNQYRNLNTKIVVAHYHTPGRKDGALAVGTSTKLRIGYNMGPSSWWQSHVIIHTDGRAQHLLFTKDMEGKTCFTTFEI